MISRMTLCLSLLMSSTILGPIVQASELSALELRQLQTRIFEAPSDKVQLALLEWCNNNGSRQPVVARPGYQMLSCVDLYIGKQEIHLSAEIQSLDSRTQIRVRLKTWDRKTPPRETIDRRYFDAVFKGIADVLVLREIGVDVKVYR